MTKLCFTALFVAALGVAQPHVYVGAIDSHSVTLAWGTRESIGRSSPGVGPVTVQVGERSLNVSTSWTHVDGLTADQSYAYSVRRGAEEIGSGTIRTWPERADSLVFFVIGDWGNGTREQQQLATRMAEESARLEAAGKHARFVMSTGDNLYSNIFGRGSGATDADWDDKFFRPYQRILRSIPFYAVLGNHDGNESENRADLPTYLDNFFFPGPEPARWYNFNFGGLAEFFALDSTRNTIAGPPAPAFAPLGEQSLWLSRELAKPAPRWRIAWMHHPMFTAGPEHTPSLPELRHWFDLFKNSGVQVVFAGHEHNFQVSERSERTGGMEFIVSGAGGQVRANDVRSRMKQNAIATWSPQRHFLIVEMTAQEMLVTPVTLGTSPLSGQPIRVSR